MKSLFLKKRVVPALLFLLIIAGMFSASKLIHASGAATTTTVVISSVNPSTVNQSVSFTAIVVPNPDGGTIQFKDNGINLGDPINLNSFGQAVYSTSNLATGARTISAVYSGAVNFNPSSGSIIQNIPNPAWDVEGNGIADVLDLITVGNYIGESYSNGYTNNEITSSITGASVDADGNLILTLSSGGMVNVGSVQGATGPAGPTGPALAQAQVFVHGGGTTFTVPEGVTKVVVEAWGGGGGGGCGVIEPGHSVGSAGGKGYAGAYVMSPVNVTPGEIIGVSIGAGGLGAITYTDFGSVNANQQGGNTSFGDLVTAGGGGGGRCGIETQASASIAAPYSMITFLLTTNLPVIGNGGIGGPVPIPPLPGYGALTPGEDGLPGLLIVYWH